MLEKEFKTAKLIAADLRGELSIEQQAELNAWLDASKENRELYLSFGDDSSVRKELAEYRDTDKKVIWKATLEKINASKLQDRPVKKLKAYWIRLSAAAAIIILVSLSIFMFRNVFSTFHRSEINKIIPGTNTAVLTLSDGRKITLDSALNGNVAEQGGMVIRKLADGQIVYVLENANESSSNAVKRMSVNTIETPRGGQYQVVLPDGTKVWLNAASSLSFPSTFSGQRKREVELTGEAYFEVFKDRMHPFTIASRGQTIEVLGTHFNVSAYPDEPASKTTLLEGSVRIKRSARINQPMQPESWVLKPGQQAVLSRTLAEIKTVDPADAIAWKDGYFMFNQEPLGSIMTKIGRWYNVQVVFEDKSLEGHTFFGTVSRFEHISSVLDMLERTGVAVFEVNGTTITVRKK